MYFEPQIFPMRLSTTYLLLSLLTVLFFFGCQKETASVSEEKELTLLEQYTSKVDPVYEYTPVDTIDGEGFTTYVLRMVSQKWLTEAELKDPLWWHWVTVVVPDSLQSNTGLLVIGGGNRKREQPKEPNELLVQAAMASYSVAIDLHNVPNQPIEFVSDTFGPRDEDEIISYGWRKFMEGGAKDEDIRWLSRMPMTTAAVRAMDAVQDFSKKAFARPIDKFVVAGGSKRGWTTWTTGIVDDRVVAIAPIVIDVLNVIPSFEHHWQAYGYWAPAVGDYDHEGVMDWQGSKEYARLLSIVEPYHYLDRLTMPKLLINGSGDQFFLPDSWKFYWNDLKGEKYLRYVPNSEHSMRGTDALATLIAFHKNVVENRTQPQFDWSVENGEIVIQTKSEFSPASLTLWKATNPEERVFRVDAVGRIYESEEIEINENGNYRISVDEPESGYTAFFVELAFGGDVPMKLSTGIVVTPDTYQHEPFQSDNPKGTPMTP
ncbi:MAG: PhoPQ-activated pathogenicity-related family protein [Bacteroidia bacterium]